MIPPYMGVFLTKMRFLRLNVQKSRQFPESLINDPGFESWNSLRATIIVLSCFGSMEAYNLLNKDNPTEVQR